MPDAGPIEETGGKASCPLGKGSLDIRFLPCYHRSSYIVFSEPVPGKWFLTGGPDFQICRSGGKVVSEP